MQGVPKAGWLGGHGPVLASAPPSLPLLDAPPELALPPELLPLPVPLLAPLAEPPLVPEPPFAPLVEPLPAPELPLPPVAPPGPSSLPESGDVVDVELPHAITSADRTANVGFLMVLLPEDEVTFLHHTSA